MRFCVSCQFVAEHISFFYNVTIIKNGPHALICLTANHMKRNFPFLFHETGCTGIMHLLSEAGERIHS